MVRDSERQFLAAIRNLYFFRNTHRRIYFKGIGSRMGTVERQIFLPICSHTRTRDYAVCSKRQGRHEMENAEKPKNAERTESVGEGKEAHSRDDQKVLPRQARNERGGVVRGVQGAHGVRPFPS